MQNPIGKVNIIFPIIWYVSKLLNLNLKLTHFAIEVNSSEPSSHIGNREYLISKLK